MKITPEWTDDKLLAAGYFWKTGVWRKTRRLAFIRPIEAPMHSFYCLRIVPKFYMPQWLAVLIFRCFKAEWAVDTEAKIEVFLAANSDTQACEWKTKS